MSTSIFCEIIRRQAYHWIIRLDNEIVTIRHSLQTSSEYPLTVEEQIINSFCQLKNQPSDSSPAASSSPDSDSESDRA